MPFRMLLLLLTDTLQNSAVAMVIVTTMDVNCQNICLLYFMFILCKSLRIKASAKCPKCKSKCLCVFVCYMPSLSPFLVYCE